MSDLDSMFDDLLGGLDDLETSREYKGSNNANLGPSLDSLLDDLNSTVDESPQSKGSSLDDLLGQLNLDDTPNKNTQNTNQSKGNSLDDLLGQLDLEETPKTTNNTTQSKGSSLDDLLGQLEVDMPPKQTQEKPSQSKGSSLDDLLGQLDMDLGDSSSKDNTNQADQRSQSSQGQGESLDDLLGQLGQGNQSSQVNQSSQGQGESLDDLLGQLGGGQVQATGALAQGQSSQNQGQGQGESLDDLLGQLGGNQVQATGSLAQGQNSGLGQQGTQVNQNESSQRDNLDDLLGQLGNTSSPGGNMFGAQSSQSTGSTMSIGLSNDPLMSEGYIKSIPRPTVSVIDVDNNTASNFSFKGTATAQIGKKHVIQVCPLNDFNQPCPLINYSKYLVGILTSMNTGKEVQVYTKDNGNATYDIAFVAPEVSMYYLEILLCGNPLFELQIDVKNISGSNWRAVAGQAKVNETFEISLLPAEGFDPSVLTGPLAFAVDGSGDMKDLAIKVNEDNTYTISAVPNSPGKIMFQISLHGEQVMGSPLNMFVINPQQARPQSTINIQPQNNLVGTPTLNVTPNNNAGNRGSMYGGVTQLSANNVGNRGSMYGGVTQLTPNNGGGVTQLSPNNAGNRGSMYGGVTQLTPNNGGTNNMGGNVTPLTPNNSMSGNFNPRGSLSYNGGMNMGSISPQPGMTPNLGGGLSNPGMYRNSMLSTPQNTQPVASSTSNDDELEAMMKELENYQ